MIGRHSRGLPGVVAMLAAFGLGGPPPPKPEEAEKAMDELHAAGINSLEVMEAAGDPSKFVETARRCLDAQPLLAAMDEPGVTDVGRLLAPTRVLLQADAAEAAALARAIDDISLPTASAGTSSETEDAYRARLRAKMARPTQRESDRGMIMQGAGGPVDFKRAGEESRARRVVHHVTAADVEADKVFLAQVHASRLGHLPRRMTIEDVHGGGQAGLLEVGPDGWRSSAVVIKSRNRPAKSRDQRDAQAADRKARARRKARRGW